MIQTEELDAPAAEWLRERCEVVRCPPDDPASLGALLPEAAGLVVRTYTTVDAGLLDRAPRLRVVGRAGVGLDRIDVPECRRRGVEVVHTPDANSDAVAEFVFALLLDALRPRAVTPVAMPADRWCDLRTRLIAPVQLRELTLGVLGLGRVGSRVARIGAGFGMPVLYHDLAEIPPASRHGARPVDLPDLLARSDVLTIHVDNRAGNRGLMSETLLARLKPGAVLVNTSRGLVMDTPALARWLRANPAARALIDVHDPEPFGPDYPLLGLPNATLTPHLAAATATAHRAMSWVVRDVWRVLCGERPEHPAP